MIKVPFFVLVYKAFKAALHAYYTVLTIPKNASSKDTREAAEQGEKINERKQPDSKVD